MLAPRARVNYRCGSAGAGSARLALLAFGMVQRRVGSGRVGHGTDGPGFDQRVVRIPIDEVARRDHFRRAVNRDAVLFHLAAWPVVDAAFEQHVEVDADYAPWRGRSERVAPGHGLTLGKGTANAAPQIGSGHNSPLRPTPHFALDAYA